MVVLNIVIVVGLVAFITFTSIYEHRYYKQLKEKKDSTL